MKDKKVSKGLVLGIVVFVFAFFAVFMLISNFRGSSLAEIETEEDAQKQLEKMLEKVRITETPLKKASVSLEVNNLANEVPDIDEYDFSVRGNADVDLEIFATSEKSGDGKDGWLNEVAKKFNGERKTLSNGSTVSVSIRPMSSGLGADYIISGKYLPDAYTPSNALFGKLIEAQGGEVSEVCELAENAAGMLLSKSTAKSVEEAYGEVSVKTVCQATEDGVITMGYTNPLTSATGLNFLMSTLSAYGGKEILGAAATEGFTKFQENVPYVAYTTLQMRDSAKSGSLNGMVMEYQLYVNDSDLKADYEFTPFGIPHNNPLYAVGELSAPKKEALELFADYCKSEESIKLAKKCGFYQLDYDGGKETYSGAQILGAQKLWKLNKDSGKDILAVFVADVSGSMAGDPLNSLKTSLTNAASYINENNYIGLVSYSDDVAIDLPLGKFDLNQRSYFQGAVENLSANGGTASYDAVCTAAKMLTEAKKDHSDAKQMIFLLSDGAVNSGWSAKEITPLMKYYKIPIYTIAYGAEADTDELETVSTINEAACIRASSEDVVYQLKQLFNAQM